MDTSSLSRWSTKLERQNEEALVVVVIIHPPHVERVRHRSGSSVVQGKVLKHPEKKQPNEPNERVGTQRMGHKET